jgi:hypothetical protein
MERVILEEGPNCGRRTNFIRQVKPVTFDFTRSGRVLPDPPLFVFMGVGPKHPSKCLFDKEEYATLFPRAIDEHMLRIHPKQNSQRSRTGAKYGSAEIPFSLITFSAFFNGRLQRHNYH